eukprot:gene12972-17395_t
MPTNRLSRNENFTQLFDHFPVIEPLYLQTEIEYDSEPVFEYMKSLNYTVPVISVIAYLLFCYYGKKIMQKYQPFGLNNSLALWNLFLSVFSTYGAIRTVPHMLHRMYTLPFEDTVCEKAHVAFGEGACGLAVQLFILSKIPELIDTVFIVLRKKPLIFLHWYHHVTVLLYCWNSYVTESSAGLYFVSMNYTVHSVMYFYYFLQAIKAMPKWFPSWIITIMQISQMFIGTFIVGASMYYHFYGGNKYEPGACNNRVSNLVAGGVIYASYLYLFCEFAVKRFIFGVGTETKKSSKKKA